MDSVPDWDRRYAAITDLLDLIRRRLAYLDRRAGDPTAFAAAGLARCRRLTLAIDLQRRHGLADTVGAQLRTVFETWAHAMWLLLETDVAYPELGAGDMRNMARLVRFAELEVPEAQGWSNKREARDLRSIVDRVGRLLKDVEDDEAAAASAEATYNILYRGESRRGAHGGIGAVVGHLSLRTGRLSTREVREEAEGAGEIATMLAAGLTGHLALRVVSECGVGVADVDRLVMTIGRPPPSG